VSVSRSQGFALVETLIATAIVAAALGVTWQVVETGARQTRGLENRRLAILVAQSQLAAVGAAQNNSFGDTRGVTDGIAWRITVRPYTQGPVSMAKLETITVVTGIDKERRDLFSLSTVRVAR
jgi:type II secretory pathway pseudopilin PulG